MHWLGFLLLVLASTAVSYARRERRYRPRWQSLERPAVVTGMGAYRSALTVPGRVEAAPWPLRLVAFTCIFYGRAVTWSLIGTAVGASSLVPGFRPVASTTMHALVGYFSAGLSVGALLSLLLAALVLGAGNDLLLRDHRGAFRRTRGVSLASMALHGFIAVHATWPVWLVGVSGRDLSASLAVARVIAAIGFVHAAVLFAMAHLYRAQLTTMSSTARELEV